MNMDDDERLEFVKLSENELNELAEACNRYPNISLTYKLLNYDSNVGYDDGDPIEVEVYLER